jgi:hypothetical protein
VLIDELLRKEKDYTSIEKTLHREGMIIGKGASSTDILGWDFSVMGAKSYVPKLSENVRRSLEYKRRNGEWGGNAPLGYLNQRDGEWAAREASAALATRSASLLRFSGLIRGHYIGFSLATRRFSADSSLTCPAIPPFAIV